MSNDVSAEQLEIMQEFVHESRDMLDQLEPIIIELGQSCQHADCWSLLNCADHRLFKVRHAHSSIPAGCTRALSAAAI